MPSSDYGHLNVLVAEDNEVNQMVIEGLLGKFGITPDFADDGKQALDKFSASGKSYDVVLMDCEMPILDGLGATRKIRDQERNAARDPVLIIALTAHVNDAQKEKVIQCGMDCFISKPVTLDKIQNILDRPQLAAKRAAS